MIRSWLLDVGYLVLGFLALPRLLGKDRGDWAGRFGKGARLPETERGRVLFVAVSVGEVNLLRTIVPAMAGEADVVVASTTDTGFARAEELFGGEHAVVRYPLDFSWCVRRFLDRVRPDVVALVELELWPNFLGACGRRGVPVAVVNGRMSDRSAPRYRRFRFVTGRWFRRLAVVGAQDERSAARFRAAGARDVRVTGNMKWDSASGGADESSVDEVARRLGVDRSRPVVVAGSTGPGEVDLLREALPAGAQLIAAPRKPEWFEAAAAALPGCARWSDGADGSGRGSDWAVLDVIGRLGAAYALADVVVVGRSFGDLHGSDPMEPAALGKAALIGPAHADFRSAVEALSAAGGLRVVDPAGLGAALAELIGDEDERRAMGERARRAAEAMRGASAANAGLIRGLLG